MKLYIKQYPKVLGVTEYNVWNSKKIIKDKNLIDVKTAFIVDNRIDDKYRQKLKRGKPRFSFRYEFRPYLLIFPRLFIALNFQLYSLELRFVRIRGSKVRIMKHNIDDVSTISL